MLNSIQRRWGSTRASSNYQGCKLCEVCWSQPDIILQTYAFTFIFYMFSTVSWRLLWTCWIAVNVNKVQNKSNFCVMHSLFSTIWVSTVPSVWFQKHAWKHTYPEVMLEFWAPLRLLMLPLGYSHFIIHVFVFHIKCFKH